MFYVTTLKTPNDILCAHLELHVHDMGKTCIELQRISKHMFDENLISNYCSNTICSLLLTYITYSGQKVLMKATTQNESA